MIGPAGLRQAGFSFNDRPMSAGLAEWVVRSTRAGHVRRAAPGTSRYRGALAATVALCAKAVEAEQSEGRQQWQSWRLVNIVISIDMVISTTTEVRDIALARDVRCTIS